MKISIIYDRLWAKTPHAAVCVGDDDAALALLGDGTLYRRAFLSGRPGPWLATVKNGVRPFVRMAEEAEVV